MRKASNTTEADVICAHNKETIVKLDDDNIEKINFFLTSCLNNYEKYPIFRAQGKIDNAKEQNENNRIHFKLSKTIKIEFIDVKFLSNEHAVICERSKKHTSQQTKLIYIIIGCATATAVIICAFVFILFKMKVSSTRSKLLQIICLSKTSKSFNHFIK